MLTLITALASVAWGWPPVTQNFRVGHRTDLDDVGAAVDDDYFKQNGVRPAAWARVGLFKNGALQAYDWTDGDGIVTFSNVDPDDSYVVQLLAYHDFEGSGRHFYVRDDVGGDILTADTAPFNPPTVSTTTDVVFDAAVSGQEWINLAAVGSWMIARRPAAWPTYADNPYVEYTMVFLPPPTDPDLVGQYDPSDTATYINPNDRGGFASKYIIAHEFAHQLQHWVNVPSPLGPTGWGAAINYAAADDANCPYASGDYHYVVSKEYQSAAILEGMADWIAAVAFNGTDGDDCRLKPYGAFPWIDGSLSVPTEFSCQGWDDVANEGDDGGVEWTGYSIDAFDYLGDYCAAGTTDDRGTELDWLRFFWDLDRSSAGGEAMDFADLVDLYADAQSFDWPTDPNDPSYVSARELLFDAFDAAGFASEWAAQDHNGIDR
jgi:hypothetical protein